MERWTTPQVTWTAVNFRTDFNQIDYRLNSWQLALTRQAFDAWEDVLDINFVEMPASFDAQIQVGLVDTFDGPGGTLGETSTEFFGTALDRAVVAMDDAEFWTSDPDYYSPYTGDPTNFYAVMAHEIGHAIGLDHTRDPDTLMYPFTTAITKPTEQDIAAGAALYGRNPDDGFLTMGSAGADRVFAAGGDDTVLGGNGGDEIYGGAGRDELRGQTGRDKLFGDSGNDTLLGGDGGDTLNGGSGNDRMNGGADRDVITGGRGNEQVWGGAAKDRISGQGGRDTLRGGDGDDTVNGGSGTDRVEGNAGRDSLAGGSGNDTLLGAQANDTLKAGHGNDLLRGGAGRDRLEGGSGRDTLRGDDGDDWLNGQAGPDRFVLATGSGFDRVRDYTDGEDRLLILTGADDIADLTLRQSGNHVVVRDAGATLLLEGTQLSVLDAGDFLFS